MTGFIPGPDLSGIGQIAGLIKQLISPDDPREREIEEFFLQNPEVGQQFASAQREAERQFESDPPLKDIGDAAIENVTPNVLEQFGFSPDKTQQLLSAFPETGQERLDQARIKAGLPALQVESEISTLRENIATSGYREKLTSALDAKGIPELAATQAAAEAALGTDLSNFQKDYLAQWRTHLEGLKESNPFQYRRALAAMNSPEFLRDLQFKEEIALRGEELDVRGRLAEIDAAQGSAEQELKLFGLGLDAQKNLDTQLETLERVLKEGEEADKALAIDRVNEAAALIRAVSPAGATFAIDPGKRKFFSGRLKGIRFTRLAPGTLAPTLAVQYERLLSIFEQATGDTTFEGLQQQLVEDADGRAFLGELTPQERSKFLSDAQQVFRSLDIAEFEPVEGESAIDAERRRIREEGLPGVQAFLEFRRRGKPSTRRDRGR